MHPILKDGVNIGTFQYDDEDPAVTHYYAENAEGEEFEITEEVFHALLHADGTRPLALPDPPCPEAARPCADLPLCQGKA